jgi:large subunit ribosomal protein L21
MYAVIATGGKQYKVEEGNVIVIERLAGVTEGKVTFPEVLAVGGEGNIRCGAPKLEGASVEGEIVKNFRGPKLVVFKMKRRKGFRKKNGHRQELTQVKISKINA